jgi:hypothetical protein
LAAASESDERCRIPAELVVELGARIGIAIGARVVRALCGPVRYVRSYMRRP